MGLLNMTYVNIPPHGIDKLNNFIVDGLEAKHFDLGFINQYDPSLIENGFIYTPVMLL